MERNNTGQITTPFSNTIILARNVDEEFSAGVKLRLRAAEDDKFQYFQYIPMVRVNAEWVAFYIFSTLEVSFPASLQSLKFNNSRDDRLE